MKSSITLALERGKMPGVITNITWAAEIVGEREDHVISCDHDTPTSISLA